MIYNPQKSTWLNPNIEYLFNDEIIEYDIRDAGFTLIKQYQLLPPEKIQELEKLGKGMERHIAVGKLQRDDKKLSETLMKKFAEIREIFIMMNHLTDDDIISVKKDAIYVIGTVQKTKFGKVEFLDKNTYSSYIRFPNVQNLEIYYSNNGIDIKGMSDSSVNRHRLYMMEFLSKIISLIESHSPYAKRYIMQMVKEYKFGELEEGYYLEFNNLSKEMNPIFNYQNILIPLVQIMVKELV